MLKLGQQNTQRSAGEGGQCPSSEQQMSFQRASSLFPAVSAGLIRENDFVWPALRKKKSVTPVESCHIASLWNRDMECCLLLSPGESAEIWLVMLKNDLSSHTVRVRVLVAAASAAVPGLMSSHRPRWEHPSEHWGGLCAGLSLVLQSWGGGHSCVTAGTGLRDGRAVGAAGISRSASPLAEC